MVLETLEMVCPAAPGGILDGGLKAVFDFSNDFLGV